MATPMPTAVAMAPPHSPSSHARGPLTRTASLPRAPRVLLLGGVHAAGRRRARPRPPGRPSPWPPLPACSPTPRPAVQARDNGDARAPRPLSKLVDLLFPGKDTISFEVVMKEESMDHVMVAVARKKAAKAMQKEERDLQKFASFLASAPAGKKWVADELAVVAESKKIAGELISEAVLDQIWSAPSYNFTVMLMVASQEL